MSLEKVKQVKSGKPFRFYDIIVYGVVLALVAVSFILVFTLMDKSPLKGVKIFVDGEAVFICGFEDGGYEILSDCVTVESTPSVLKITVKAGGGFNEIEVDKSLREVRVSDADCRAKICTYMRITDNSGVIHCAQHRLKIEPYDYNPDDRFIPFG